jgi:hypothetical protein
MNRLRARRTLFASAVGILVLHLGINLALETVRPEWRDPEFGWRIKALQQLARTEPIVLALGSSRTQMGLAPKHLQLSPPTAVYNFGQSACGLPHLRLNLQRILDANIRPHAVLIEVMPAALYQPGRGEAVFSAWAPRFSYRDLARVAPYCDDPSPLRVEWLIHRVSPWHSLRLFLLSHWLPGFLPWQHRFDFQWRMMDAHGFVKYPHETIPDAERAKQLAFAESDYARRLREFSISPMPDRALRDMLTLCRDLRIPVALYLMPESPKFRSWYPAATQQACESYLAQLRAEYCVPIFDARDWLAEDDFADGHHQLRRGAEKFSQRFGREYLQPWLNEVSSTQLKP